MKLVCYAPLRFHGYNVLQCERNCKPFLHISPQNFIGNRHNFQCNVESEFKYSTYEELKALQMLKKKARPCAAVKAGKGRGGKNGGGYVHLPEQ
ncbi:MAG: hypothetical protein RSB06_02180, partial [Clostridia bacterium]